MTTAKKKQPVGLRLSTLAIQILDAIADQHGLNRTAILEMMIRKEGLEVEDRNPKVYELLHPVDDF